MRFGTVSLTLLAGLSATLIACGGDDSGDDQPTVDARVIDGTSTEIDAPSTDIDAALPIDAASTLAGDVCGTAETITPPANPGMVTVTGTTTGYTNDYNPPCEGVDSPGFDRVHAIALPANTRVTITVHPTGKMIDPGLYLIAGPAASCDATEIACLASSDSGFAGDDDTAVYDTGAAAENALVLIDSFDTEAAGDYELTVEFGPIPDPIPGDTCQLGEVIATPTTAPVTVSATTLDFNNDYTPGCAMVNSGGPDRVHVVTVPAGSRLTATVDPTTAGFDPGIYAIAAPPANCDAAEIVCLTSNDAGGDDANDAITWNNTGTTSVDVQILIDGFRQAGGAYDLIVTVAPIPAIQ